MSPPPVRPFLLAGRHVASADHIEVHAPWDGRLVSRVSRAHPEHLEEALQAAVRVGPSLARSTGHQRATILERARALLERSQEELAQAILHESGKPVRLARGEVQRGLDTLTDAAWAARALTGTIEPLDAVSAGAGRIGLVRRFPAGPMAAITPFNFPVNLVLHKLAPAIAAGCPVILKPAPETPTAALLLGDLLIEAGLPPDALSVLPMDVADAGPLASDRRLRVLSFTGSASVGWLLRGRAIHHKVLLELGGTAANIVCADADLDDAIPRLATGAFAYAGQSCVSVQNILVHRSIYDEFTTRFTAQVTDHIHHGDPSDEATLVGPIIRSRDADRIQALIRGAVAAGGRLLSGGGRRDNVIEPTVLADVPADASVVCEEVFGPVATLAPFDTLDEVFAQVNSSRYGLQAALFTRDLGTVLRAHAELDVGGIIHNDASAFRVDAMPYGGVKDSGNGREGPRHAVLELTEPRLLVLRTP